MIGIVTYIAGVAIGYIAGFCFGRATEIRRRIREYDRISRSNATPTQENECTTP